MEPNGQTVEQVGLSTLFRATIGFDFLFAKDGDGRKRIFCLELNGEDSYIPVDEIEGWDVDEATRERVRTRMTYNPERVRRALHAESLGPDVTPEIKKQAWAHTRAVHVFENAVRNEPHIKNLVDSKKSQQPLIPCKYRPRSYARGESPLSSTGFWICKPSGGQRGKGVHILSNDAFAEQFVGTELEETHVAQEFITALGADKAPESMRDHPAVLRLVLDIEYIENDTITELFSWANQSISPYSTKDIESGHSMEEVYVITVAERNAKVVPVSKEEFEMAYNAGLEIIRNIAARIKATRNN